MVDINGNTINLYEILDEGLIAIVDISTTWCPPCWSLHQSHALQQLHEKHGPDGSNQLRVLFYEADASTTMDDLNGSGSNTKGDWITGITYPIFNENPITIPLSVWASGGFPTVNIINPSDKKIVGDSWDKKSYDSQVSLIEETTGIVLVDNVSGTEDSYSTKQNFVFPNPTSTEFYIDSKDFERGSTVTIINMVGQVVLQTPISSEAIQVSHLDEGIYMVRVGVNNKLSSKLIISRP